LYEFENHETLIYTISEIGFNSFAAQFDY